MSIELYLSQPFDLCDLFQAAARDTWARIRFSRTIPRLKIHETTITQNLVYELSLLKQRFPGLPFTLYESNDEAAQGDDLELCVLHQNGRIYTYAIQAKILYHNLRRAGLADGTYPRMRHDVGGQPQIRLLQNHAGIHGYIPLYLLYNYIQRPVVPDIFGCTVTSAWLLQALFTDSSGQLWGNIRFSELHSPPYAFPWQVLVCEYPYLCEDDLRRLTSLPEGHALRSKSPDELANDPDWQEVAGTYGIINDKPFGQSQNRVADKKAPSRFAPRFRLYFGNQDQIQMR
jgi:hypothetical protein